MSSGYVLQTGLLLTNSAFGHSFLRDAPSEDRKRSIDFHVKSDDYFGTIATVLGLISDSLKLDGRAQKDIDNLKDELVYLQERYMISRKE